MTSIHAMRAEGPSESARSADPDRDGIRPRTVPRCGQPHSAQAAYMPGPKPRGATHPAVPHALPKGLPLLPLFRGELGAEGELGLEARVKQGGLFGS